MTPNIQELLARANVVLAGRSIASPPPSKSTTDVSGYDGALTSFAVPAGHHSSGMSGRKLLALSKLSRVHPLYALRVPEAHKQSLAYTRWTLLYSCPNLV